MKPTPYFEIGDRALYKGENVGIQGMRFMIDTKGWEYWITVKKSDEEYSDWIPEDELKVVEVAPGITGKIRTRWILQIKEMHDNCPIINTYTVYLNLTEAEIELMQAVFDSSPTIHAAICGKPKEQQ